MSVWSDSLCLEEDGSIELGESIEGLCFHQALNVLLVTTTDGRIRVFDPHSSLKLSDVHLHGDGKNNLVCVYHGESNSVVVCGGRTVGMRRDHHGVLLLGTVLQAPVAAPEETVIVEMLLSEGIQLQQTLAFGELSNIDHAAEVQEVLAQGIAAHQAQSRINPKLAKWSTLRLELPLGVLRSVCLGVVSELKRLTRYIPALSIASALIQRLAHLLPPPTPDTGQGPPGAGPPDREAMCSEAARLATFIKWPHMNYKWALPEQMAQAGFFHQPIAADDDRAMCFICSVCLVYWEPTDEPWSEHERHSPNCPFVKGEYTNNVPLSVTYATSPALTHSERTEEVAFISHTNSHQFIASATKHGNIVVWNTAKQLKKEVNFSIDPSDSTILDKHFSDTIGYTDVPLQPPAPCEAWTWGEEEQNGSANSENDASLAGRYSECDTHAGLCAETDALSIQSPGPPTPPVPPASSPSPPPPPPPPASQVVELPLDDIAVDELFAPPRPSHDVRVSSLCVLADPIEVSQRLKGATVNVLSSVRSCLVVGVGLRRYELFGTSSGDRQETCDVGLVQVLNNVNQASQREAESLDIMKLDSSRRGSTTEEENDIDCVALESESASLSDPAVVSSSASVGQQNFVPYLLVYDLNVNAPQPTTSNKVATKSVTQGPYKKSTVKVGTFGQTNIITHPKTKHLWSDPPLLLHNDIEMFFSPPNMFVKNKGTAQVGSTSASKSKAKDNQVTPEPQSKNGLKKEPKCIQCIPLPHKLNSIKLRLTVNQIVPTTCGEYVVVTLSRSDGSASSSCSGSVPTDTSDGAVGGVREVFGAIIVYRVCQGSEVVVLQEEPVNTKLLTSYEFVPKKLLLLPPEFSDNDCGINGVAACITMDGSLRLLSLSTLEFFHGVAPPSSRHFNNVVYCNSLERLCASCDDGRVNLIQLRKETEMGKEPDTTASSTTSAASVPSTAAPTLTREPELMPGELLANQELSQEVLDKCVELTQFQTGCPKFVATVPPCWSEIIQAQKQRRNPQHLQQHADDMDTTRTWRLESDSSTFDEHLFELLLPAGASGVGAVQVGHVDLKLNFIPGPPNPLPVLQVTLLRQNLATPRRQTGHQGSSASSSTGGSASPSHTHTPSTSSIPHDVLDDCPENPVLTKEFQYTHNAEILCGPVTVNRCIDLSGQGANITLTSPSLLACRSRTYLVHIKALPLKLPQQQSQQQQSQQQQSQQQQSQQQSQQQQHDLQKNSDLDLVTQYMPPQSSTFLDRLAASSNKRVDLVRGCDIIQELSITVRCCLKTTISHERQQRMSLVESESFHKSLLEAVIGDTWSDHVRHRALDMLLWVTCIHTAAVDDNTISVGIITMLQLHLSGLVRSCLLLGDRSIAHKTSKIIVTALEGSRVVEGGTVFGWAVLEALLEWLDHVLTCQSAGALHWFFTLLNHVKWCNPWGTSRKVTQLLTMISEALSKKVDPLHAVLQTRFNLYGTPFERELFDTDPPLLAKQTISGTTSGHSNSSHNTGNNNNNNNNNNISFGGSGISGSMQSGPGGGTHTTMNGKTGAPGTTIGYPYIVMGRDDSDIGALLGRGSQVGAFLGLTHTSALCGLLEVEPLHFTLHMASDGTKMERASTGSGHPGSPFMMQPFTIPGGLDTSTLTQVEASNSSGTAKAVDASVTMLHKAVEDMAVKNQAVELLLAKKATKTYLEKLQTLSDQLASMKHCLQKAKQRTQTLAKVVAAENSGSQSVDTLLPLDGENKEMDIKEETSTISSSSSDATPDDGLNAILLTEAEDVAHPSVQYMGNGDVDLVVSAKIDFGLTSVEEEVDSSKHVVQQNSYTKRKSDEDVSSLESKASTPSAGHPPTKDGTHGKKVTSAMQGSLGAPWQQLLSLPPQQMLVIERMHSGARRFVVLDFGAPVLLTDVVIPACSDLVSLSIDIWMTGEDMDGERLVVASDIGMRPLILADLQPPPLCRYLKVTTLGRYGMNTSSQCRIPVGAFYGHTLILPWQLQPGQPHPTLMNKVSAQTQLTVLGSVVEDIGCRYSLACSKLRSLLNPLLMSPTAPTGPHTSFGYSEMSSVGSRDADLERKITHAYQECMLEQQHLNLVVSVMRRLQCVGGAESSTSPYSPTSASTNHNKHFLSAVSSSSDKLATLMQYLLNCLLTLSLPIPGMSVPHNLMEWCGPEQAKVLVEQVCVRGPKGAQVGVASLLARLCAGQPWWGDFLANTMTTLFSSTNTLHFPATRVFALLTFLGQKSVGSGRGSQVIDAILRVLSAQLHSTGNLTVHSPTPTSMDINSMWLPWHNIGSQVDTHLVSWLLLYLSLCLDALTPTRKNDTEKNKENGGRWTWLTAETCLQRRGSEASRSAPRASRERLRKRLVHHQKQQLVNLETATKSLGEVGSGQVLAGLSGEIYQKLDTIRRSIVRRYTRTTSASSSGGARKDDSDSSGEVFVPLDRTTALSVAHGLIKLLMNTSSPCCVDSFLLTCKVIGGLVSVIRPSPSVTEIVTRSQLGALLRHALTLDTTWGAPWALHALTCLLQDILEGERLYGNVVVNTDQHKEEVDTFEIVLDAARSSAGACGAGPSGTSTCAGPSGVMLSGTSSAGVLANGALPTTSGTTGEGGGGSPQDGSSPIGACVATQNCQADQSATPLSPPVVSMATAHYSALEEEDLPGKYSFLDLEDSSESEDMIGEYLADMQPCFVGSGNHPYTSIELAMSNLPPPYPPPPLPNQSSSRAGKDSRIGDLVSGPLSSAHPGMDHSTAVDARLEAGVSLLSELRLHMMGAVHTSRLSLAVTAPLKVSSGMWADTEVCGPGDLTASVQLLTDVFQKILLHLSMEFDGSHVESVLGLWLSINLELAGGKYTPSIAPTVPLTPRAISALLAAVVRSGSVSMRCWCLVLQTLTLCCNHTPQDPLPPTTADQYDHIDLSGMAITIVTDVNFTTTLQKLLTGSCATGSDMRSDVVGSTVTGLLEDLLVRLRVRCDVMSVTSVPGTTLKYALLSLVARLLECQGAISLSMGPLDAQCCLLGTLLSMHYDGMDRMHVPLAIINSTVVLVHGHLMSSEGVTYGATNQNANMLGGLFASVLGSDGRQGPAPSRLALLCSLLNLSRKLSQTPLVSPAQARAGGASFEVEENGGGSLTDSSKLEQQRSDASSSQTDEHKAMHTPQTCSHAAPNSVICLADTVLQNRETMQLLLKSVSACEGSSVSMLLGTVSGEVSEKLCLGETLTDALYQLLLTLNTKATAPELILRPVIAFITPGGWWSPPLLSEAALCFFTRVLDCPTILEKFAALGGMKMLWENLVSSVGMMGGGRGGLVTAVMNHLAPPLPPSTHNTPSNKRSEPLEQTEGLYNFAPLAVVTSSNPTARPANVLVDSNQLFQRTKSAPWSYHFYPDESWVDLNLTLPCAILLHEVHLFPHTVSLVSCPSAVCVEVGVEGGYLMPVSGPLSTAGLSRVRLVLPRPVVASIVVVRLHRPRDSSTLGLSQLKLLGTTTFRGASRGVHETAITDYAPHRASMWWLRLINQCMCRVEGGLSVGVEAGASVSGVMEACVTLLLTPPWPLHLALLGSAPLEATTLALAALSPQLLHTLIMTLLTHPLLRQPAGGNSLDAAIALLYELCVGSSSMEGVSVLLSWLNHVVMYPSSQSPTTDDYRHNLGPAPQQRESPQSSPASINSGVSAEVLHCIAAVLWNTTHDTTNLITDDLFRRVYEWSERSEGEVKVGLDHIMCSMCHIRPQLFTQLLLNMSVLTVIDNNQSITDDRKDREAEIRAARTDDMKEGVEGSSGAVEGRLILQDPSIISLTPAHLQTLATVAQSPQAIHLMLDSGFPLLLVHGILEWCKTEVLHQVESCTSPSAGESATDLEKASVAEKSRSAEDTLSSATPQAPPQITAAIVPTLSTCLVAHTLHTLGALCAEPPMRDWLGSAEGSVFWLPLLTVLGDPLVRGSEPLMRGCGSSGGSDSDYSSVEDATIHLMRQCCHNHPHNQNLLASTLCHLIQRQNIPPPGGVSYLHSLSGFTRRLVLQLLLETERVVVHINSPLGSLSSPTGCSLPPLTQHPKFGAGHKTRLLSLPTTTSMSEIIKMVTDWSRGVLNSSAGELDLASNDHREPNEVGHLELMDKLSVAAGVTAKDKRSKNKANATIHRVSMTMPRRGGDQDAEKQFNKCATTRTSSASSYALVHESLGNSSGLPSTLTVAQVMAALRHQGHPPASHVTLTLTNRRDHSREGESGREAVLLCTEPLASTLHVFTSQGGLSLLAQHMSLLYPDMGQQQPSTASCVRGSNGDKGEILVENDWVSVEMNDYESANMLDYLVMGGGSSGSPGPVGGGTVSLLTLPSIPPHALGAFTLFLRLPGYAETLLKDTHKACCLLRLALGVTDDGDGGPGVGGSLATMPFQVLESLLEATPLTTDDGVLLRRMCLESGALHLILACLAALSHQDTPEVVSSLYHQNVPIGLVVATTRATCVDTRDSIGVHRGEGDRCHYWAKGTGFGTGSTTQSWDVEQALVRQKVEEEHVVWLVRLLAKYINPGDIVPAELQQETNGAASGGSFDSQNDGGSSDSHSESCVIPLMSSSPHAPPALPSALLHLFQNSGLITTIASNLSNDSVLDMSRHVPLYRALLALVRGLSVTSSLAPLLMTQQNSVPSNGGNEATALPCIPALLEKMKTTVNTYMAKLRWKSSKAAGGVNNGNGGNNISSDEVEQEEGLSLIVPDIQNTAVVVKVCTERLQQELENEDHIDGGASAQPVSSRSLMEVYLSSLKPMQFDTYEMVVEDCERGIRFVVSHHYEGSVRGAGDLCTPRRMKRLAQEAVTLSSSLPLSYSSSVFVRTDLDRLDIMKVLITGPEDTPYANGCFEFDVYFPVDYPTSPLHINLQTTGEGRVRFNPNLYQDGKVCLSILNTWHGRPEEKWNPQTSSLLQVLVSIQSLIFVSEPYFNEPGYERSRGTPTAMQNSREYDANIRAATVRWAMLNQLRNPSPCFKEVIERHFWLKHKEILEQVDGWISNMEALSENRRTGKNIAHNTVGLKKNFQLLKDEFRKMTPPPGFEGIPLSVSLTSSCSRSPVTSQFHNSQALEKERECAQEEKEKEPRGATGGQAGGPVRTRIRKTSRANLFMSKPHTDTNKHGIHSSGIPVNKTISGSIGGSAVVNSTTVKPLQQGLPTQETVEDGLVVLPFGESHSVTVMSEVVQATKATTCPNSDSKVDSTTVDIDGDVCNHMNYSSSSVKDSTPDSPSSHNTSTGMTC